MASSDVIGKFYQPAEWERHAAVWTAWPAHKEYWQEYLRPAQEQFVEFCRHVAVSEPMKILVANENAQKEAQRALRGLNVELVNLAYGDVWLRDIAPIFLKSRSGGERAVVCFRFNGWGEKYLMPPDDEVAKNIAAMTGLPSFTVPLVFEGGSLDVDGAGTGLTTRQCLLNKNRNPELSEIEIASRVSSALGVEKLLWLDDGLINDHTDGHIDNLARFVGEGRVVCMTASGADDPNSSTYEKVYAELSEMKDARGRQLEVIRIPSPGRVLSAEGEVIPASFMNFYISNERVIVPIYGTPYDEAAVEALSECFPGRKTVGVSANAILTGGGSFHCITQQEPL